MLRSKTRINNINDIHFLNSEPVLLRNDSYFTKIIIDNIHVDAHHSVVAGTLTKLRSKFRLFKGGISGKELINRCIMCKFIDRKFILLPSTPQLPKCRECCEYSFENVGVGYPEHLYIQD